MDAWETLTANAADTTDAWSALNSQEGGGGSFLPGTPVTELSFTFTPVASITGSVEIPTLAGTLAPVSVSGSISEVTLSGTISSPALTGEVQVEEI